MARFNLSQVRSDYQEAFVNEVADTFEDSVPTVSAICGRENTLAFFSSTIRSSQEAGFRLRNEIVKFSFLSLHLGLFFATDPLYTDVRSAMLWKHAGVHPNVGLNRMFRSTDLMIAEGLCSQSNGVAPGFGAACRATTQIAGNAPVDSAIDICREANIKRFQALGAKRVHASMVHASSAPRLAGKNTEFVRDWHICTFFLGSDFDRSQLFSWIPEALMRDGLAEVGNMLDG